MRKDIKIFALIFAALVVICILLIVYSVYTRSLLLNQIDNRNKEISTNITWENQTIKEISTNITWENQTIVSYGEPVLARNGIVRGHIPIRAYYPTLVMALVDEKVVPFYYNGSVNKTHMIEMGDKAGLWMPDDSAFEITGISEGVHDITFLTFIDPYNFNNSLLLRDGPIGGSAQSYMIIMANDMNTTQELKNRSFSNAVVKSVSGQSNSSFISKSSMSNRAWSTEKTRKGDVIKYYVNIGQYYVNDNKTDLPFKLIQLLDYEQVPVQYDSTDYVYTGHTINSEPVTVPMSVKAPDSTGSHKLIVLLSINPHQALDPARGDAQWEMQSTGWNHVDINVF